jgi:hypothetical protein
VKSQRIDSSQLGRFVEPDTQRPGDCPELSSSLWQHRLITGSPKARRSHPSLPRKYQSPKAASGSAEVDGAANGAIKAEQAASKPVWIRSFFGQAHTRTSPGPPQDVLVVSDLHATRIHPTTRPGGHGKRQSNAPTYILRHAQTRFFLGRWRAQSSSGPTTHLKRDPQTVVPDIRRLIPGHYWRFAVPWRERKCEFSHLPACPPPGEELRYAWPPCSRGAGSPSNYAQRITDLLPQCPDQDTEKDRKPKWLYNVVGASESTCNFRLGEWTEQPSSCSDCVLRVRTMLCDVVPKRFCPWTSSGFEQ